MSAIKLLSLLLTSSALAWMSIGFVFWNWSPELWGEGPRAFFVWLSFLIAALAAAFLWRR